METGRFAYQRTPHSLLLKYLPPFCIISYVDLGVGGIIEELLDRESGQVSAFQPSQVQKGPYIAKIGSFDHESTTLYFVQARNAVGRGPTGLETSKNSPSSVLQATYANITRGLRRVLCANCFFALSF